MCLMKVVQDYPTNVHTLTVQIMIYTVCFVWNRIIYSVFYVLYGTGGIEEKGTPGVHGGEGV